MNERIEALFEEGKGSDIKVFASNLPRNLIYFGAPGTGKSYNLNKDKEELIEAENDYERVTFHPDYSYANFVGTYKPVPKKDKKGDETKMFHPLAFFLTLWYIVFADRGL